MRKFFSMWRLVVFFNKTNRLVGSGDIFHSLNSKVIGFDKRHIIYLYSINKPFYFPSTWVNKFKNKDNPAGPLNLVDIVFSLNDADLTKYEKKRAAFCASLIRKAIKEDYLHEEKLDDVDIIRISSLGEDFTSVTEMLNEGMRRYGYLLTSIVALLTGTVMPAIIKGIWATVSTWPIFHQIIESI